jgi:hypothetical protein
MLNLIHLVVVEYAVHFPRTPVLKVTTLGRLAVERMQVLGASKGVEKDTHPTQSGRLLSDRIKERQLDC